MERGMQKSLQQVEEEKYKWRRVHERKSESENYGDIKKNERRERNGESNKCENKERDMSLHK